MYYPTRKFQQNHLMRVSLFIEKREILRYQLGLRCLCVWFQYYGLLFYQIQLKIPRQYLSKNPIGSGDHGVAKALKMDSSIYPIVWQLTQLGISTQLIRGIIVLRSLVLMVLLSLNGAQKEQGMDNLISYVSEL